MNLKTIKWIGGVLGVLIFLAFFNPFAINDATERTVVQTFSGDLFVRFQPGVYYAGFFSKQTVWPNNATIQVSTEITRSEDADLWSPSQKGTFSEGDAALLGHTVKWDLPNTEIEMLDLHTTYMNMDNLMGTTLIQYQKKIASFSTQRMSSEAHYSGGQSQLDDYFQDQLNNGQVLLDTETKTRKLENGTEKTYIQVQERLDAIGNIMRSESDIQKYNIVASFSSIDEVEYEQRIYKKLEEKIDAASDEATSKQKLITAQQQALTAKAEGERVIAETKAREEAAKIEAVIRAEKAKLVAKEELEQAKYDAASQLAIKKANAEGDRLKVAAGLTPRERAEFEMKTQIGVAQAIAGPNGVSFPTIVSGSGANGGGALQTLELKMLNDLVKDMSKK